MTYRNRKESISELLSTWEFVPHLTLGQLISLSVIDIDQLRIISDRELIEKIKIQIWGNERVEIRKIK